MTYPQLFILLAVITVQLEEAGLNEDEKFNMEKELQKMTDGFVEEVEELEEKKKGELEVAG